MFDGSARGFAVILEDQDVAESFVVLQIEHAVAIGPQNVFDGAFRESGQSGRVIRRFDDHFMRADAVHFVEEAFAFAVEIAFDAQSGKFVGHDAHRPARSVRAAVAAAIDQNLRRSLGLVAGAERAILAVGQRT